MKTTTKLFSIALLAASVSAPAFAQAPNWAQEGDYYSPGNTVVQRGQPWQVRKFKEGDYYAPHRTTPQRVTPQIRNEDRYGDYYAPNSQ